LESNVPRVISFIVLVAIVLLVGAVFFQVMAQFFVPLFLACVLIVIFGPLHRWIGDRMPTRPRLAAMLTTISIILVVVLPLVYLGWKAYVDFHALLSSPSETIAAKDVPQKQLPPPQAKLQPPVDAKAATAAEQKAATNEELDQEELRVKLKDFARDKLVRPLTDKFHFKIRDEEIQRVVDKASGIVAGIVFTGLQSFFGIIVGLFILVIALYYFLADGPLMIEAVMAVSPLDRRYEHELLSRFAQVSRAVVVATLLTALTQGALAGIGYNFALPPGAPIFLLTALTTVSALIPIFGAFAVWACVCIVIYAQGHVAAAIVLAIYCTIVVSLIDNIMKPLILHGQSKLHPLLALLSILGGIQAFGPVGILVGPMLVSFLQALLNMLRKEIESFGDPADASSKPLAESMVEALQFATNDNTAATVSSIGRAVSAPPDANHGKNPPPASKPEPPPRSKRKR
jgi:predicted PurR-regulated permease PerM